VVNFNVVFGEVGYEDVKESQRFGGERILATWQHMQCNFKVQIAPNEFESVEESFVLYKSLRKEGYNTHVLYKVLIPKHVLCDIYAVQNHTDCFEAFQMVQPSGPNKETCRTIALLLLHIDQELQKAYASTHHRTFDSRIGIHIDAEQKTVEIFRQ
jgi:hypothetical protein